MITLTEALLYRVRECLRTLSEAFSEATPSLVCEDGLSAFDIEVTEKWHRAKTAEDDLCRLIAAFEAGSTEVPALIERMKSMIGDSSSHFCERARTLRIFSEGDRVEHAFLAAKSSLNALDLAARLELRRRPWGYLPCAELTEDLDSHDVTGGSQFPPPPSQAPEARLQRAREALNEGRYSQYLEDTFAWCNHSVDFQKWTEVVWQMAGVVRAIGNQELALRRFRLLAENKQDLTESARSDTREVSNDILVDLELPSAFRTLFSEFEWSLEEEQTYKAIYKIKSLITLDLIRSRDWQIPELSPGFQDAIGRLPRVPSVVQLTGILDDLRSIDRASAADVLGRLGSMGLSSETGAISVRAPMDLQCVRLALMFDRPEMAREAQRRVEHGLALSSAEELRRIYSRVCLLAALESLDDARRYLGTCLEEHGPKEPWIHANILRFLAHLHIIEGQHRVGLSLLGAAADLLELVGAFWESSAFECEYLELSEALMPQVDVGRQLCARLSTPEVQSNRFVACQLNILLARLILKRCGEFDLDDLVRERRGFDFFCTDPAFPAPQPDVAWRELARAAVSFRIGGHTRSARVLQGAESSLTQSRDDALRRERLLLNAQLRFHTQGAVAALAELEKIKWTTPGGRDWDLKRRAEMLRLQIHLRANNLQSVFEFDSSSMMSRRDRHTLLAKMVQKLHFMLPRVLDEIKASDSGASFSPWAEANVRWAEALESQHGLPVEEVERRFAAVHAAFEKIWDFDSAAWVKVDLAVFLAPTARDRAAALVADSRRSFAEGDEKIDLAVARLVELSIRSPHAAAPEDAAMLQMISGDVLATSDPWLASVLLRRFALCAAASGDTARSVELLSAAVQLCVWMSLQGTSEAEIEFSFHAADALGPHLAELFASLVRCSQIARAIRLIEGYRSLSAFTFPRLLNHTPPGLTVSDWSKTVGLVARKRIAEHLGSSFDPPRIDAVWWTANSAQELRSMKAIAAASKFVDSFEPDPDLAQGLAERARTLDALLLSYYLGEGPRPLWIIASSPQLGTVFLQCPLDRSLLVRVSEGLEERVAKQTREGWEPLLEQLFDLLFCERDCVAWGAEGQRLVQRLSPRELLRSNRGRSLVVARTGALTALPLEAARDRSDDSFVITHHACAHVPALRFLLADSPTPGPELHTRAFLVQNDDASLPGAASERRHIRELLEQLGVQVREEAPTAFLSPSQADLFSMAHVHFAGHGFADSVTPQRSRLALMQSDKRVVLSAMTLGSLQFFRSNVVLSACESTAIAGGLDFDPQSLGTAILARGASRVLGASWPVDDRAAHALMRVFYTALGTRKLGWSRSLRRAQLACIQGLATRTNSPEPDMSTARSLLSSARRVSRPAQLSSPLDWAGFCLMGWP